jgi:hypothetical protein
MKVIKDFTHVFRDVGLFNKLDVVRPVFLGFIIEFHEYGTAFSLATGKAVQDPQILAFSKGPQFVQEVFGRAVKADIHDGQV